MLIDLQHVTRFYGTQQALHDVTLQLPPGRIGLLGPNGAGKSTLLKILMGLLPPSSGSGRVLDHQIGKDGAALRRAIGYMPEADALIPGMRGAEYVALAGELYGMPRRQAQRRAHEVLTGSRRGTSPSLIHWFILNGEAFRYAASRRCDSAVRYRDMLGHRRATLCATCCWHHRAGSR